MVEAERAPGAITGRPNDYARRPVANSRMIRAFLGFELTAFRVKRYCDPPSRNPAREMLNAPRDEPGVTLTETRLKSVSVRLIVTVRLLAPPAKLTVAPQNQALPMHLTVRVPAALAGPAAIAPGTSDASTAAAGIR